MFFLAFQPHKWYNKSTTKPVITRCDLYKSEVVSALRKEGFDGKDVHALNVIPEKMGLVEHWGKIWMTTEKGVKHTIYRGRCNADAWHPSVIKEIIDFLKK